MIELRIRDASKIIDENFARWLVPYIRTRLIASISQYKLAQWDDYITNSTTITKLYDKEYKASDIIIFAANNIVYTCLPGEIIINFDNTKFIPGFDRLRIDTIVKLINYGTLEIKGCPIFLNTFNYFEKHIDLYVKYYYRV